MTSVTRRAITSAVPRAGFSPSARNSSVVAALGDAEAHRHERRDHVDDEPADRVAGDERRRVIGSPIAWRMTSDSVIEVRRDAMTAPMPIQRSRAARAGDEPQLVVDRRQLARASARSAPATAAGGARRAARATRACRAGRARTGRREIAKHTTPAIRNITRRSARGIGTSSAIERRRDRDQQQLDREADDVVEQDRRDRARLADVLGEHARP